MNKNQITKIVFLALLVGMVVLLTTYLVFYVYSKNSLETNMPLNQTTRILMPSESYNLQNRTYQVQVARTEEEQAQGLSGIADISANEGMLFILDAPKKASFWMKDMLFAIDLYWIRNGQVVGVEKNMQPPPPGTAYSELKIYNSPTEVDAVLEVKAENF